MNGDAKDHGADHPNVNRRLTLLEVQASIIRWTATVIVAAAVVAAVSLAVQALAE